jgi:hypothetical protein
MTRSRIVVVSAFFVLVVGSVVAIAALYLDPARASIGPLPSEAMALPGDSRFVMGIDVKKFVASPFYERYAARKGMARPDAFAQLEERTGLVPERDLHQIIVSGRDDSNESGVAVVSGSFDRYKLSRAIETANPRITSKNVGGTTVYLYKEGARPAGAVAFLDQNTLAIGSQSAVETVAGNHAKGQTPLRFNVPLMALVGRVRPDATVWMVGDQTVLSHIPPVLSPQKGQSPFQLPALKSLMITGDLAPLLAFEVVGETADPAAATNLADLVRGFVALASMQAQQKPELKALSSAVSVTTDRNQVRLSARLPYELLDSLQPARPPAAVRGR